MWYSEPNNARFTTDSKFSACKKQRRCHFQDYVRMPFAKHARHILLSPLVITFDTFLTFQMLELINKLFPTRTKEDVQSNQSFLDQNFFPKTFFVFWSDVVLIDWPLFDRWGLGQRKPFSPFPIHIPWPLSGLYLGRIWPFLPLSVSSTESSTCYFQSGQSHKNVISGQSIS